MAATWQHQCNNIGQAETYFLTAAMTRGSSRRALVPGPPGHKTQSKSFPATASTVVSAHGVQSDPKEAPNCPSPGQQNQLPADTTMLLLPLTAKSAPRAATVTSTPARRRISIGVIVSISSNPSTRNTKQDLDMRRFSHLLEVTVGYLAPHFVLRDVAYKTCTSLPMATELRERLCGAKKERNSKGDGLFLFICPKLGNSPRNFGAGS
eukprot:97766-Rhodomonas_salina.2